MLSLIVSAVNINHVIESELSLIGKTDEKLPPKATVLNCNVERLIQLQRQLFAQISGMPNVTLYTDETSKYGTKVSGYHVSEDICGMYVTGMRELVTKSGQDILTVFQEILGDINEHSFEADVAKKILLNISAIRSNYASTEKRFNFFTP